MSDQTTNPRTFDPSTGTVAQAEGLLVHVRRITQAQRDKATRSGCDRLALEQCFNTAKVCLALTEHVIECVRISKLARDTEVSDLHWVAPEQASQSLRALNEQLKMLRTLARGR